MLAFGWGKWSRDLLCVVKFKFYHFPLVLGSTSYFSSSTPFSGLAKDRDLKQKGMEILVVKCCTIKAFCSAECDFELELRGVDVSGTRGWNSNMVSLMHTNTHTIILRMVMDVVEVCRLLCSCDVHLMSEWFTTSSPF